MRPKILEEDRETSAILLNRSQHSIAEIQQVWTFEEESGRTYTSSIGGGANPSVLLPFGLSEKVLNLYRYWKVILPGSKRYLGRNGEQVGDNSDVRPPAPAEQGGSDLFPSPMALFGGDAIDSRAGARCGPLRPSNPRDGERSRFRA